MGQAGALTNVPVVNMARYVMVLLLRRATSLRGALEGVGPENQDFLGPEMATSEASAIWATQYHVRPALAGQRWSAPDPH